MKNNKIFLAVTLIFLLLPPLLYGQNNQQNFQWTLITSWSRNFPIFHDGVEKFVEDVRVISKGRLKIEIKAAGEIVGPLDVFKEVSKGEKAQIGHSAAYYWAKTIPAAQFMTTVPFGMTAKGNNAWFYQGGGLELWRELYAPYNVIPFPMGNTGVQMGGWFNREINSIEDFKGLRMRIPGLGGDVLKVFKVKPVLLAGGQILEAFEKNQIDATEWVGPYHDRELRLYKVAKYYYYPGWHEPGTTLELIINSDAWNQLPEDLQKTIEVVAGNVNQWVYAQFEGLNLLALTDLEKDREVKVRRFPQSVLDRLREETAKVLESKAQKNADFKRVYEAFKNFRTQNTEWSRISDDAYQSGRTASAIADDLEFVLKNIGNIKVQRVKTGEVVVSFANPAISFSFGSSKLWKESVANLKKLATVLFKYPDIRIQVEGHTDNSGSEDYNETLSKQRANSVSEVFANVGIPPSKLKAIGYGESRPLPNIQGDNSRNRRVEVRIFYNTKN